MSGSTINTTITVGVTLGSAGYASPLTITTTGFVDAPSLTPQAVLASIPGGYILNQGSVQGGAVTAASQGVAIELTAGTLVSEGQVTGGTDSGAGSTTQAGTGVYLVGAATVSNSGTIHGGTELGTGSSARGGYGVDIKGGYAFNAAGGVIFGGAGNVLGGAGVLLADGTVSNYGSIFGGVGATIGAGITLTGAGTVVNAAGATIASGLNGIYLTGNGTIDNSGLISGGQNGISLARNTYTAASVITNEASGTITGGANGDGFYVTGTGTMTALGTFDNRGLITGSVGGIYEYGLGAVVLNTGTIQSTGFASPAIGDGVDITGSGAVINGASDNTTALITAPAKGFAVYIGRGFFHSLPSSGTVINYATIAGMVDLNNGGTVVNGTGVDTSALINGVKINGAQLLNGTYIAGAGTRFENFATVSVLTGNAVYVGAGVAFNGSATDTTALVETGTGSFSFDQFSGTVSNYANILGGTVAAVYFGEGSFTNFSSGLIDGTKTGFSTGGPTTLTNFGTIVANTGITTGPYGNNTVINAGTIASALGNAGTAISFGRNADRLIDDVTGVFVGTVSGGTGINTIELAAGAGTGTLTGLGTQFINFGSIAFDPGADWFVGGNTAGLAGTISGFAAGDTIEITGITVTGSSYAGGVLTLEEASGSASLTLPGTFTTNAFVVTNVADGTDVTLLCFCANTLIETPTGSRAVQDLAAGDLVLTFGGAVRPITWVGTGAVLATRGRRSAATPVIVRKAALADNVPYQDLRVTKGHSFLVDDVLIPVEFLVNHASILWDDRAQEVKLYHIELETHDVLIANGAPAESYRDDGNRWLFQNANEGWDQPAKAPYAPVLTGGPVVQAAWERLLDRAGARAPMPLTDEPDLHLVVGGKRVDATRRDGDSYVFSLPGKADGVRIVSRAAVPQELGLARDQRSLGVALRRIVVRRGARSRTAKADDARLATGFHQYESENDLVWTDGDAVVPVDLLAGFSGPVEVVLMIGGTTRYIDDGVRRRVA